MTPQTQERFFQKRQESQNKKRTDEPKRGRTPQANNIPRPKLVTHETFNFANNRKSVNVNRVQELQMLNQPKSRQNLLQNYMTANLSNLIRQSNKHQSTNASYDQHGRRSSQSPDDINIGPEQIEAQGKLDKHIEEQYSKFSKQYDEFFTSHGITMRGSDVTERSKSNNNNFQNNINNSIILLQAGKDPVELNNNMDSLLSQNLSRLIKEEKVERNINTPKLNIPRINLSRGRTDRNITPSGLTESHQDFEKAISNGEDSMQESKEEKTMLMKLLYSNLQRSERYDAAKKKAKKQKSPVSDAKLRKKRRAFDPSPISEIIVEKPEDSSHQKNHDSNTGKAVKEFQPFTLKNNKKKEVQKMDSQINELKRIRKKKNKIDEAARVLTQLLKETGDESAKKRVFNQIEEIVKPSQSYRRQHSQEYSGSPIDVQIFDSGLKITDTLPQSSSIAIQETTIVEQINESNASVGYPQTMQQSSVALDNRKISEHINDSVEQKFTLDPQTLQEQTIKEQISLNQDFTIRNTRRQNDSLNQSPIGCVQTVDDGQSSLFQVQQQIPDELEQPSARLDLSPPRSEGNKIKSEIPQQPLRNMTDQFGTPQASEAPTPETQLQNQDPIFKDFPQIVAIDSSNTDSAISKTLKQQDSNAGKQFEDFTNDFNSFVDSSLKEEKQQFENDKKQISFKGQAVTLKPNYQDLQEASFEIKNDYYQPNFLRMLKLNKADLKSFNESDWQKDLRKKLDFFNYQEHIDQDKEMDDNNLTNFGQLLNDDIQFLSKFNNMMKRTSLVRNLFGDLGYQIDDSYIKIKTLSPRQNVLNKFASNFTKQILKASKQSEDTESFAQQRAMQKKKTEMLNQFVDFCQSNVKRVVCLNMDYTDLILQIQMERKSFLKLEKQGKTKNQFQDKIRQKLERKLVKKQVMEIPPPQNNSSLNESLTFGLRTLAKGVVNGTFNVKENWAKIGLLGLDDAQHTQEPQPLQKGGFTPQKITDKNEIKIEGIEYLMGQREYLNSDSEDYDFNYKYQQEPYILDQDLIEAQEKEIIVSLKLVSQLQKILLSRIRSKFHTIFCQKGGDNEDNFGNLLDIQEDDELNYNTQLNKVTKKKDKQKSQEEKNILIEDYLKQYIIDSERQQEVYRSIMDELYEVVGGKHVVFISGNLEEIIAPKKSKAGKRYADFGYSYCRITEDLLDYKSDAGSRHLNSTISQASLFQNLETLVDYDIDSGSPLKEKFTGLVKIKKQKDLKKKDSSEILVQQIQKAKTLKRRKQVTLFGSDDENSQSYDSSEESSFFSDESETAVIRPVLMQKCATCGHEEMNLFDCEGDEDIQIIQDQIACDFNDLIAHLKKIIIEREYPEEMIDQIKFLLFNDLTNCGVLFASILVNVKQIPKMEARNVIQYMESMDFRLEGQLLVIFDNYNISSDFNHLTFDESALDSKISQSGLSREKSYFDPKMTRMKEQILLDCSFISMSDNKLKLDQFINDIIVPKQNFNDFVETRLLMMSSTTINSYVQTILDLSLESFWEDEQKLEIFLWQKKKKLDIPVAINYSRMNCRIDIDDDDLSEDTFIQQDKVSKIANWNKDEMGLDNYSQVSYSISDDCDGVDYNNIYAHEMNHLGISLQNILKGVIFQKNNASFQIFNILSQTKSEKIKNMIILSMDQGKQAKSKALEFLDKNKKNQRWNTTAQIKDQTNYHYHADMKLKQIKQISLKKIKEQQIRKFYMYDPSDASSEPETDDDINQTAKYLYIEHLQKKHVEKQQRESKILEDREKKKQEDEAERLMKLRLMNQQRSTQTESIHNQIMIEEKKKQKAKRLWALLRENLKFVVMKIQKTNNQNSLDYQDLTKSAIFNMLRSKTIRKKVIDFQNSDQKSSKKKVKKLTKKTTCLIESVFEASGSPGKKFNQNEGENQFKGNSMIIEDFNFEFNAGFRYGQKPHMQDQKHDRNALPPLDDQSIQNQNAIEKQEQQNTNERLVLLKNGYKIDISKDTQPFFNISFDGVNMKQQRRIQIFVNQIQSYYLFIKNHMLSRSPESSCFFYPYTRKPRLFEDEINDLQRKYLFDKILEQKRINSPQEISKRMEDLAFKMDISNPHTVKYVNPFEAQLTDSKGKLLDDSYLKAERFKAAREKEKRTKLLTKKATYVTAISSQQQPADFSAHKMPTYRQGGKARSFRLRCKLVSNGKLEQKLALEKQMHDLGDNLTTDVEMFSASIDPNSGYPLYWLFEIIEVVRKKKQDLENEKHQLQEKLTRQYKSKLNYLEVRQNRQDLAKPHLVGSVMLI